MQAASRNEDPQPCLIAIDWGTSRFRAYLVSHSAQVLEEVASAEGIGAVSNGGYPQILLRRCGEWLNSYPKLPVLMAGMIGSRNGWKEVPYVPCPASLQQIRAGIQKIEISPGQAGGIVPGLIYREAGVADVIRGEETLIIGAQVENGSVVLPGTHSKWAEVQDGEIRSFKTFMTGECYSLLRQHSVLRLLAREPDDRSGLRAGIAASKREGGLLHQAFQARTAVLDGQMRGEQVGPFVSGLLIAHEVGSAAATRGTSQRVVLVAEGNLAMNYGEVITEFGLEADVLLPRHCFVKGMLRLVPDWLS
jgi:2-dehydro-3-deoxygalactonokinase